MIGYDGQGHKLGPIRFHVPVNPMDPWGFTSEDGRFEMTLKPIFHHISGMNFVIFSSKSIIAYGYYSGTVVLDDGTKVQVENLLGHAEAIKWRW